MKRLDRKSRGLDYVRFLAEFSKREGFRGYGAEVLEAFGVEAARELASVVTAETRIAGIRSEAMFMAVVAGLGRVPVIKSEDEGDVFYLGADIRSPDFRIMLPDGGAILVEVKVFRMKNIRASLKLGDTYVQQLRRYAELMKPTCEWPFTGTSYVRGRDLPDCVGPEIPRKLPLGSVLSDPCTFS